MSHGLCFGWVTVVKLFSLHGCIIIIGRSFEEHLHHLQKAFDCLISWSQDTAQQVPFSAAKGELPGTHCFFRRVSPDPSKMSKVKEWPTPKMVLGVQA